MKLAEIPIVENADFRPLWSVMIPHYNCESFLSDCLKSVLAQDLGRELMEIIVVDDASTKGNPKRLVEELGRGRVQYFRQEKNVGSVNNFNTAINLSRGNYVHLLHCDDVVMPGYYREISTLFQRYPQAGAAFSSCQLINGSNEVVSKVREVQNEEGILQSWLEKIAVENWIQTPSITVKREVYESVGGFSDLLVEDWEMWVRIAKTFDVAYTPRVLCQYRIHYNDNNTTRYMLSGRFVQDVSNTIDLIQNHLPENLKKQVYKKSRSNYAIYFTREAIRFYRKFGDKKASLRVGWSALKLYPNSTAALLNAILFLETLGIKLLELKSLQK